MLLGVHWNVYVYKTSTHIMNVYRLFYVVYNNIRNWYERF